MDRTEHTPLVRRLTPADGSDILSLYARCGRDGAWCGADTLSAVFSTGAWWGGFSDGALCLCAPAVPADAALPQASMLRDALAGFPVKTLLLPPAVSPQGTERAETLLPALLAALDTTLPGALPSLAAAVPMKYPPALMNGYFTAGLSAFRVRPLLSLRPNYLLAACTPEPPVPGTVSAFCMPLDGTLAISRLLEQGYCLTALRHLPPDPRLMGELRRASPPFG